MGQHHDTLEIKDHSPSGLDWHITHFYERERAKRIVDLAMYHLTMQSRVNQ